MARASKQKSLTALAKSLDTRKQPLPARASGAAQRRALERAVRPEVRPRIEAALARQPLATTPAAQARQTGVKSAAPARPPESRAAALQSLSRSPSPAPTRTPAAKAVVAADPRRRYPRAEVHVRARLQLADDPTRFFEATLPTVNLSVGGLFLESSFFLKVGTRLLVTLSLPRQGREVRVKGEVVRLESNGAGHSGFALRFTEYLDGSQVVLATHFLSPVLKEFLVQYAKEHRFDASAEYLAHTADVLAAWELKKAELGGDVWALFASGE